MKTKIILATAFILALTICCFGQVKITPKETEYTRTGENVPDHKKKFTVKYPVISGVKNPMLRKRIENSISYWSNFETKLDENLSDTWLYSLDYAVNYNKNSILDIRLVMEGSGAYPSMTDRNLVIDLRTGKRVYLADAFRNIGKLLVKIEKKQNAEIKASAIEDEITEEELRVEIGTRSVKKLEEFSVGEKGVTFLFDYDFPHAIKALEPPGKFFFTWRELRPHIKRGGLLEQFVS